MNKLTLAMNAWRAYSATRRTEGSSLRGKIIAGVSVVAVATITLLRGDLTATDVGIIAASISGLDAVLAYFIPDQLGSVPLTAQQGEFDASPLPAIDLIGESQTVRADGGLRRRAGDSHPDPDRLPRPPVRPVHNTDEAIDHSDFPGWGS